MKNQTISHIILMPFIIPALMLGTADSTLATHANSKLSLKIHTGAGSPTEDYLATHFVSGFGIILLLEQRMLFSLDVGYWNGTVEGIPAKFYDGRLKSIPLLASFQYFFTHEKRVNPYAFLGPGYIFSSFEMEDIITIPEITIDQSLKNGFCFQVGMGIDIPISHSLRGFAETAYFHRKSTGITKISDLNFGTSTEEFPVKLHSWIFRIGIKYFVE